MTTSAVPSLSSPDKYIDTGNGGVKANGRANESSTDQFSVATSPTLNGPGGQMRLTRGDQMSREPGARTEVT